jgi:NAD+ kinase
MTSTTGSTPQSAEAVRRAAVVMHGKPATIGGAEERLGRVARDHGIELVDGDDAPDVAIVLGGDGTMLRALHRYLGTSVPVIGVNFGRVGFLASIPAEELESGLGRVFAGEVEVLALPTLAAAVGGQERAAINDVVATSGTLGRMVEIALEIGGEDLGHAACDGIIAATPAGSTAYNLSSGGPVLAWGLEAVAVTHVAPHSLHARPLVVPKGREIAFTNRTPDVDVTVVADGHAFAQLGRDESVRIRLDDRRALLATLPEATFFRRYRETFAR